MDLLNAVNPICPTYISRNGDSLHITDAGREYVLSVDRKEAAKEIKETLEMSVLQDQVHNLRSNRWKADAALLYQSQHY